MSDTQQVIDSKDNENIENKEKVNASFQQSKSSRDEVSEKNCKFEQGQELNFVRVRFPGHNKSYPFLVGKRKLMYGQKVVAMSDRGVAVGYINSFNYKLPFDKSMLPLRYISKLASQEDIEKEKDVYKKQKDAETLCQDLIEKHNLDMNLTHVEFTQFGKKVVFYFVAPARVDFRGLVKDLVTELKLRIELRQISVRDRAASMGALGPCGRELCCSSFLSKYGNVSIKMAKNQNLTLNYSKLNGVCGQLKCCLQYEDEVYSSKRKKLPDEGSFIMTKSGEAGRVNRVHILSEQFDLLTTKGHIKRFISEQFLKTTSAKECRFPDRFDNISDETATVVGLSELESKKTRQFEKDIQKINKRAHKFAHNTFTELTGVETEYIEKQTDKENSDKSEINELKNESNEAKNVKSNLESSKIETNEQTDADIKTKSHKEDDEHKKSNKEKRNNKNNRKRYKHKNNKRKTNKKT